MTEKSVKAPNYSPELEARLVELYNAGNGKSVADIAAEIDRPEKSVRGKLVSLKVYVPQVKPVKTFKDEGPSKKNLLASLAERGFSADALKGLENATKPALAEVIERTAAKAA
jgi:hypothetical protein